MISVLKSTPSSKEKLVKIFTKTNSIRNNSSPFFCMISIVFSVNIILPPLRYRFSIKKNCFESMRPSKQFSSEALNLVTNRYQTHPTPHINNEMFLFLFEACKNFFHTCNLFFIVFCKHADNRNNNHRNCHCRHTHFR